MKTRCEKDPRSGTLWMLLFTLDGCVPLETAVGP